MEQRRLLLPAFHGERMQRLIGRDDRADRRARSPSWPAGEPMALHPRLQQLTLEIILRAVFGLEEGRGSTRCGSADRRAELQREPAVGAAAAAARAALDPDLQRFRGGDGRDRRADLLADRRAPGAAAGDEPGDPAATTSWRCCWPPAMRTAPRCRTRSCATS